MQKESAAAQKEMRKIKEDIDRNEKRFRQLSDRVDKYKMVDAEMAAKLQGLYAGGERRGSKASQVVDCCMETMVKQFFARGLSSLPRVRCSSRNSRPFPLQRRCQDDKNEEGKVKTNKSKTRPLSSWR